MFIDFIVQTWKSPFIFLLQPFHPQTVVNFLNNIVGRKETLLAVLPNLFIGLNSTWFVWRILFGFISFSGIFCRWFVVDFLNNIVGKEEILVGVLHNLLIGFNSTGLYNRGWRKIFTSIVFLFSKAFSCWNYEHDFYFRKCSFFVTAKAIYSKGKMLIFDLQKLIEFEKTLGIGDLGEERELI